MGLTNGGGEAEPEADEGVGEGHDGGDDGEPRHVVEVRYEGEEELRGAEDEHVVAAAVAAGRIVPVLVVAVGLQDCPATIRRKKNAEQPQRGTHKASKHSQGQNIICEN